MALSWHTKQERRVIKKHGGTPLKKSGYDGTIKGKPVEVRSIRKDHRYRIQKDVHAVLIKSGGGYIFVNRAGESKRVSAKAVSVLIGRGGWYRDRDYPHKFVYRGQIWE